MMVGKPFITAFGVSPVKVGNGVHPWRSLMLPQAAGNKLGNGGSGFSADQQNRSFGAGLPSTKWSMSLGSAQPSDADIVADQHFQGLVEIIKNRNYGPERRGAAVWELGKLGGERVVESLFEFARHEDSEVRHAAIEFLKGSREGWAFELLHELLRNAVDVWIAAEGIQATQGKVTQSLLKLLTDKNPSSLRIAAINVMGESRNQIFARPLSEIIECPYEAAPVVRAAVRVLENIGGHSAIHSLMGRLREEISKWLVIRKKPGCDGRANKLSFSISSISSALANAGGVSEARAIWEELSGHSDPEVARVAQIRLNCLQDPTYVNQHNKRFAQWQSTSPSEQLMKMIENVADVYHLADALGFLGGDRIRQLLIELSSDHYPEEVRLSSIYALKYNCDERVLELLKKYSRDAKPEIRSASALALRGFNNKGTLEPLAELAIDPDEQVRFSAYYALGETHDERAFELLLKLLTTTSIGDQGSWAAGAALSALAKTGKDQAMKPLLEFLTKHPHLSFDVVGALAEIGSEEAIQELLKFLDHKDPNLHNVAIDRLAKIGNQIAIEGLIRFAKITLSKATLLESESSIEGVRAEIEKVKNVIAALGKIGGETAFSWLKALVENANLDTEIRCCAIRALGRVDYSRAFILFNQMLGNPTEPAEIRNELESLF